VFPRIPLNLHCSLAATSWVVKSNTDILRNDQIMLCYARLCAKVETAHIFSSPKNWLNPDSVDPTITPTFAAAVAAAAVPQLTKHAARPMHRHWLSCFIQEYQSRPTHFRRRQQKRECVTRSLPNSIPAPLPRLAA